MSLPGTSGVPKSKLKKKILVVGNGGAGIDDEMRAYVNRHTGEFLRELSCAGISVEYAELISKHVLGSSLSDFCLNDAGIEFHPINSRNKMILALSLVKLLRAMVSSDLVYVFYPGSLPVVVCVMCLCLRIKYALYVRGEKYSLSIIGKKILQSANFICSVSPSFQESISHYCNNVSVIRPMMGERSETRITRSPPNLESKCWKLLYVGRLEEDKGILELVQTVDLLTRQSASFHLRMIGAGPLRAWLDLHPLVRKFHVIDVIEPIFEWDELSIEFQRADLFVFLSHHEGFPRVLYEAMLHSLPIMTSFVGGIPGRMVDGVNCIRVPVYDAEAVSLCVVEAISDPLWLYSIGCGGFSTVVDLLSSSATHAEIVEGNLYEIS
jgi:glycosyltransferase involved in cell wall biosynthesis